MQHLIQKTMNEKAGITTTIKYTDTRISTEYKKEKQKNEILNKEKKIETTSSLRGTDQSTVQITL